jgi:hypothetical protein
MFHHDTYNCTNVLEVINRSNSNLTVSAKAMIGKSAIKMITRISFSLVGTWVIICFHPFKWASNDFLMGYIYFKIYQKEEKYHKINRSRNFFQSEPFVPKLRSSSLAYYLSLSRGFISKSRGNRGCSFANMLKIFG